MPDGYKTGTVKLTPDPQSPHGPNSIRVDWTATNQLNETHVIGQNLMTGVEHLKATFSNGQTINLTADEFSQGISFSDTKETYQAPISSAVKASDLPKADLDESKGR